ncbi:MAG: HEAT repeat domain-containing protein [Planctomycetales bacterium]|nr:HEAT repeat domain-containing protein [Planctomycetales bacterium]
MRRRSLLVAALATPVLLGGALAAGALADEETATPALEDAAQKLVAAASERRKAEGSPGLVWSEIAAVVLREHLEHLLALGWRGGPVPPEAVKLDDRISRLHAIPAKFFEQYHACDPASYDPQAALEALAAQPAWEAARRSETRLAAAALRPADGRWFAVMAVVPGDAEPTRKGVEFLAPYAEKARGKDAAGRAAALRSLGETKIASALPAIREGLRHAEAATREAAAAALGMVRSRGAVPPLLHALEDPAEPVRAAAGRSLAALSGGPDHGTDAAKWREWWKAASPTLVISPEWALPSGAAGDSVKELLAAWDDAVRSQDFLRRMAVLQRLREHPGRKEPAVRAVFVKALEDPKREVRYEACRALALSKWPGAVPTLIQKVKGWTGADKEMAAIAIYALAQIGDGQVVEWLQKSPIVWQPPEGEILWAKIHAARYVRQTAVVEWLVGLWTSSYKQVADGYAPVIGESLADQTGQSFEKDGAAWRKWWKGAKGSFRPEPLPEGFRIPELFPGGK